MLKRFAKRRVRSAVARVGSWFERRQEEELAIAAAIADGAVDGLEYPSSYVRFLRDCMRPQRHDVKEVRTVQVPASEASRRFATLLDMLSSDVPAAPLSAARTIATVADGLQGSTQRFTYGDWAADVGAHFTTSSSFGCQGRLIACVVRFMRSNRCLELGTAYGLSALFILAALQRNGERGHLTTLEATDPQFSFAAKMLHDAFRESVTCYKGLTYEALPALLPSLGSIDFLYHDAGHSRKDYVTDFGLVEPVLGSGATVLVDDINWTSSRFYRGDPQTHAGWMDVVAHERVVRAVELDGKLGLLLLR